MPSDGAADEPVVGHASEDPPPADITETDLPYELDGEPVARRNDAARTTAPALDERRVVRRDNLRLRAQDHRMRVTMVLIGLVAGAGVALFVGAFLAPGVDEWTRFERAAEIFLVPMFTLLGTAVGWYFGGDRGKR